MPSYMPILKAKLSKKFTTVSNASVAQNRLLSFRARGLLLYMLSLPPDWKFNLRAIAKTTPEGRESVVAAKEELEAHGHLFIHRIRGTGRFLGSSWTVVELPRPEKPDPEKPDPVKPRPVKPSLQNTKDTKNSIHTKEDLAREFKIFFDAYGKIGLEGPARRAYALARRDASAALLLQKAREYAAWCRRQGRHFIHHASNWLSQGLWREEYAPAVERPLDPREALRRAREKLNL